MRPISTFFRTSRSEMSGPPGLETTSIMDVSSDLETPEPIFDLRRGNMCISDLSFLAAPESPVEWMSYSAIRAGHISYEDLLALVCSFPDAGLSSRPIFSTDIHRPRAFLTGACVHGGSAGLLSNTQHYPWSTRLFCSIARQQAPSMYFTSIAANLNCQSSIHRDSHNHSVLPSAVIPASFFTGGQLWIENVAGSVTVDGIPGDAIEIRPPYVTFQPRLRHRTLSWTGNRLVIVLYHVHQAWRLSESSRRLLDSAGFHVYSSDVLRDPYM